MKCRKYEENDYGRVIDFLRDIYREDRISVYWLPQRWEYADKLVGPLHKYRGVAVDWKDTVYLWEERGEPVGLLCSEYPDENITILTREGFRNPEEEMVKTAEEKVIKETLGRREIKIRTREGDSMRERMLTEMGYEKQEETEYLNRRNLGDMLPGAVLPEGYAIHDMTDENGFDLKHKIAQITAAFESDPYPEEIYRKYQKSRFYKKEYDLYTTDTGGAVTSFCIIWYDPELNNGYFEPVGTDAAHRGKGLAKATLGEGMRRLKKDGVETAFVGAANTGLMKFYNASGFTSRSAFHPWYKKI